MIVGTDYNTKRKLIWGSGQLENLAEKKQQMMVSALMINVDMLSPLQQVHVMIIVFFFEPFLLTKNDA